MSVSFIICSCKRREVGGQVYNEKRKTIGANAEADAIDPSRESGSDSLMRDWEKD